jgi:hypothetical protein
MEGLGVRGKAGSLRENAKAGRQARLTKIAQGRVFFEASLADNEGYIAVRGVEWCLNRSLASRSAAKDVVMLHRRDGAEPRARPINLERPPLTKRAMDDIVKGEAGIHDFHICSRLSRELQKVPR